MKKEPTPCSSQGSEPHTKEKQSGFHMELGSAFTRGCVNPSPPCHSWDFQEEQRKTTLFLVMGEATAAAGTLISG